MFNSSFKFLLFSAALLVIGILAIPNLKTHTDTAFAAPKGITTLKLFNELASVDVETVVNDWLAAQSNIAIDSIDVDTSGSYQIAIGYHSASGVGAVLTRIKLFSGEDFEEGATLTDHENVINTFVNSLSSARNVRALDVTIGTGRFPAVFVLYD